VQLHLLHLDVDMFSGLYAAAVLAPKLFGDTLLVTSAADGKHRADSLHYVGRAWDLRFRGKRVGGVVVQESLEPLIGDAGIRRYLAAQRRLAEPWAARLGQVLGPPRDVVLEDTHIHIERER
jgi:hypothetical protein